MNKETESLETAEDHLCPRVFLEENEEKESQIFEVHQAMLHIHSSQRYISAPRYPGSGLSTDSLYEAETDN